MHVTLRLVRQLPSLRTQLLEKRVRAALAGARRKSEERGGFQIVHFSIQSDHLHLIVEARRRRALSGGVAGFEVRVARAVNRALRGRRGRVFADRYHRHDLTTPTEVRNALRYVLCNFRKHARVIGDAAAADPWSSGAVFDGWREPVEVFESIESRGPPWEAVGAWTWLLRVGWRRRGLLSPREGPA